MLLLILRFFLGHRRQQSKRHLWDKTSDKWEHDMYREEEQGPKEQWELEVRVTVHNKRVSQSFKHSYI